MKRLVVVLLTGVLGAALLCLGASQKLTNQTGAPASGVTLTFSEAVRITSYDSSVFPNPFPASGESESFTFSSGTLAAGGVFQLAWSPSEARIVVTKWTTSREAAQGQSSKAGSVRRGVCTSLELVGPRDVQTLAAEWNVNLLRLCIGMTGARGLFATLFSENPSDPVALPEDLARLDKVLDECAANGIAVVISLMQTAGYECIWSDMPQNCRPPLWQSEVLQQRLVRFWETIAQHCAGRGAEIYGYDILNEAHDDNGAWNVLAKRLTQAIRVHDGTHSIIVESSDWGSAKGFSRLVPTQDANTIYSFHFYVPGEFTHQGHYGNPLGKKYPAQGWDRRYLEKQMQPVVQFQEKWHVPILVGEFGASGYADPESRAVHFEDCASLFEEKGFDYCYFSYRDNGNWTLDHDSYQAEWGPMARYVESTPVLDVALRHFAANVRSGAPETKQFPRCLFDESHWLGGDRQFDRDRNVMSEQLAFRVTSYCDTTIHASGDISSSDLSGIDLLVLGRATLPLATTEVATIESFVRNGGSVLVYGDAGVPTVVNSLLAAVGMRFDSRCVLSSNYDWGAGSFWVPFAPTAGVLKNSGEFHTNYGGSVDVGPPARAILLTDANAWVDVDGNGKRDSADIGGPVALAAIAELGAGRVAFLSDNQFTDSRSIYFVFEVVRWLLRL